LSIRGSSPRPTTSTLPKNLLIEKSGDTRQGRRPFLFHPPTDEPQASPELRSGKTQGDA
jgi:hypothetical protein